MTKNDFFEKCLKVAILSSFALKLIAIVTMTLDHLGLLIYDYAVNDTLSENLRNVGRFALPLFCFMIVEGVIHTRSFSKYILRMGVIATAVLAAQIFMEYVMGYSLRQGNIFLDLILCALMIKCLMSDKWFIKLLAILPIAFSVLSYWMFSYEAVPQNGHIDAFPYFLRMQYSLYSCIMALGYYLCGRLGSIIAKNGGEAEERILKNLFCAMSLVIVTLINYFLEFSLDNGVIAGLSTDSDYNQQNYAMISGVFILLYSGKRGYNAKWFKYGQYLYYPLHILALFGIFTIIFGY